MTSVITTNPPWLIRADNICDYIPGVSTLVNLVNLFQKCVLLPKMDSQNIQTSHYYTYLEKKQIGRCVMLLIPVLGNIVVGLFDFNNNNNGRITFGKIRYTRATPEGE